MTGLFMAGQFTGSLENVSAQLACEWDTGLAAYTPRYWGAISLHAYPINTTQTLQTTANTLNGVLAHGTGEYISSYVDPLVGANTPIFITEFNCCAPKNDKFLSFHTTAFFWWIHHAHVRGAEREGGGSELLYTDNADYHDAINR